MPVILKFAPKDMAWLHGQIGMLALQGLHSGHLIHADGALAPLDPLGRTSVHLTAFDNLLIALGVRLFG